MATARKDENLTNRQIQTVAAEVSITNMKILAEDYLNLPVETIEELFDENKRDEEGFNRAVIIRWRNVNSEDQVEVSTFLKVLVLRHKFQLVVAEVNVEKNKPRRLH